MCAFFSKVWRTLVFADSYKIMISCKVTSSKVLTISDKVFKSYCEVFSSIEANVFVCFFRKKTLWVISVFLLIGKIALNIKYIIMSIKLMLNFLVFQKTIQLRINNSNLLLDIPGTDNNTKHYHISSCYM